MSEELLQYPASDLDGGNKLLAATGAFYQQVVSNSDMLKAFFAGCGEMANQTLDDINETADVLGIQTAPVFHSRRWAPVKIWASALNSPSINPITVGQSGLTVGDGYSVGEASSQTNFIFPLPDNTIVSIDQLFDAPGNTQVVMTNGVDFIVSPASVPGTSNDGYIAFLTNPFLNSSLSISNGINNGLQDRVITLFGHNVQYDKNITYTYGASLLGLPPVPSSPWYKQFASAAVNSLSDGGSEQSLREMLSAAIESPLVKSDGETVKLIISDSRFYWIITDQNAYSFPLGTLSAVSVGQVVNTGDTLSTILTISQAWNSTSDIYSLPSGGVMFPLFPSLSVANDSVPLTISYDSGYAEASFPIGANSQDLTNFWNSVRAYEKANNVTLSSYLLEGGAYPSTVNPLEVVLAAGPQANLIGCSFNLPPDYVYGPVFSMLGGLRRFLPPGNFLIISINVIQTVPEVVAIAANFQSVGIDPMVVNPMPPLGDIILVGAPDLEGAIRLNIY